MVSYSDSFNINYSKGEFKPLFLKLYNQLEEKIDDNKKSLLYLFSSRGSFPFFYDLSGFYDYSQISKLEMNVIPSIFSIRNLYDLTNNGQLLKERFVKIFLELSYDGISKDINKKLSPYSSLETIVTDWDEIITGFNLNHRLDIYNKLDLRNIDFHLYSFIDEMGLNLEKKSYRQVKNKINNMDLFSNEVRLNDIPWSDDDSFYSKIGLEYSLIALPNLEVLSHCVKSSAIPKFLDNYLTNYNDLLSKSFGLKSSLKYSLVSNDWVKDLLNTSKEKNLFFTGFENIDRNNNVRILDDFQISKLFDKRHILSVSKDAFIKTFEDVRFGDIKYNILSNKFKFILGGVGYKNKLGKEYLVLNTENQITGYKFKNPYLLVFNNSKGYEINSFIQSYYSS